MHSLLILTPFQGKCHSPYLSTKKLRYRRVKWLVSKPILSHRYNSPLRPSGLCVEVVMDQRKSVPPDIGTSLWAVNIQESHHQAVACKEPTPLGVRKFVECQVSGRVGWPPLVSRIHIFSQHDLPESPPLPHPLSPLCLLESRKIPLFSWTGAMYLTLCFWVPLSELLSGSTRAKVVLEWVEGIMEGTSGQEGDNK